MKHLCFIILFYSISSATFGSSELADTYSIPPVAENDTFFLLTGCGNNQISGNVLANDFDPDGDEIAFYYSTHSIPRIGDMKMNNEGVFNLTIPKGFLGSITFEYYIQEKTQKHFNALGEVIIYVLPDNDCDNVSDEKDIDDDNDGILDVDEGNGSIDSDNDGIANSFDIDSDNDGITDNQEWQTEGNYIFPERNDINLNGWDDAYDIFLNGTYYKAEDTNMDGIPDFIDIDSDNDGVLDLIEGFDLNDNNNLEIFPLKKDFDRDGLDDAFDTVESWTKGYNASGSSASLPDTNNSGVRDWREMPIKKDNLVHSDQSLLYPNPTSGNLTVSVPDASEVEKFEFLLFNINGELVFKKSFTGLYSKIELANYKNGTYIAKIQSEKISYVERIIIHH